ncbi:MAG: Sir2 family NAD-dependent protein deacetylase [Halobacteriales archaeon]|nr:Sir2 family NAD-dependent protein deacetylase [Halobacteriales archaeon]
MTVGELADAVREAESVVAFTGAGVSTASGIPDFRSEGGIWETHDRADFRYDRFRRDPAGFWADRLALQETMYGGTEPEPNAAHEALVGLAVDGHLDAVVTQNVDGLHADAAAAAGIDLELVELHGNARAVACIDCGEQFDAGPAFDRARAGERPPTCQECGGVLKPCVILFGERLDTATIERARALARRADVLLATGSSLTVEPAASLPRLAGRTGATLAVVNLTETPYSDAAEVDLRADVTEALPALRAALRD